MNRTLADDALDVWNACQTIRHGDNYGRKLIEAGTLTSLEHHSNDRLKYVAHQARELVVREVRTGPEVA